jgi:hypothetical protein
VDAVIAESPDGPLGDPVKFWRAAWDAKFRVKTAHGGSRTGDTMAAARSLLREG